MARPKKATPETIVNAYMEEVLTHGKPPLSVHAFAKAYQFKEAEFYQFFSSFKRLEQVIFEMFMTNTLKVLHESDAYETYSAHEKLLSFYYTFFENLTANRSFVVYALHQEKNPIQSMRMLALLKEGFTAYVSTLSLSLIEVPNAQWQKLEQRGLQEAAWGQLMYTLHFWLTDESPNFEKTDVWIEKSVKASFDVLQNVPLKSLVDLGKFFYKEKIQRP